MHSHGPLNSASAFLPEAFCQPYNLEVIPSPVLLYSTLASSTVAIITLYYNYTFVAFASQCTVVSLGRGTVSFLVVSFGM